MKLNELNEKQKAFVREYSIDWNGTRAYRKVYGIESEDVASANSSRLLGNAKIQRYLKYCKDHVEEVAHISKLRILSELKKIALSSIADSHDTWITLKEFNKLTDDQKACIQSIEPQVRTEKVNGKLKNIDYVKIKLFDKMSALANIAKMMAYNQPDKIDITSSDNSLRDLSTAELIERSKAIKEIR